LGFIDISGTSGRRFGSIGVAIEKVATRVILYPAVTPRASGASAARAHVILERLGAALDLPGSAAAVIESAIPEHVGLGSGTQMALALGTALLRLYGRDAPVADLVPILSRGARSGIGLATFEGGGLIVDGGHGPNTVTPPVIARLPLPESWRFILVFDRRGQGLHGKEEIEAFRDLPPFPAHEATRLSHLILMQALPAVAEADLPRFGSAITEIQRAVGDYFAPAQGGRRFASPDVAAALAWFAERGAVGIGQSSWGPTGFCLVESEDRAAKLVAAAQAWHPSSHIEFVVTAARNRGAEVAIEKQAFAPRTKPCPANRASC
jgi:beta-RFAP synthase